jgi:hypothetical protein
MISNGDGFADADPARLIVGNSMAFPRARQKDIRSKLLKTLDSASGKQRQRQ